MKLRKYKTSDCEKLAMLFYQTVHCINSKDYTQTQISAWASGAVDLAAWDKSFKSHYTVVACKNDLIVGFGDIDKNGYLDRLFVHKDYQRQGIASAICEKLENFALHKKITVFASITAKPFFERRGYRLIREQQVSRDGVLLTNFLMEK